MDTVYAVEVYRMDSFKAGSFYYHDFYKLREDADSAAFALNEEFAKLKDNNYRAVTTPIAVK